MGCPGDSSKVVLLEVLSTSFSASEGRGSLIPAAFPESRTEDDEPGKSTSGLAICCGEKAAGSRAHDNAEDEEKSLKDNVKSRDKVEEGGKE